MAEVLTKDEKARAELRKLRAKHRPVREPKTYIAALENAYIERLRINYGLIEEMAQFRRDYRPREPEPELNGHITEDVAATNNGTTNGHRELAHV